MSVPEPAPLPRLGEVFFDVRGNSRSMRLSWYADTGVAVFSIWQAGMCTGTFRLPIADLGRMIELLQRGPTPRRRGPVPVVGAERVDGGFDRPSGEYRPAGDEPRPASGDSLSGVVHGDYAADYGAVDYRAGGDHGGGVERARYETADESARSYGASGYGANEQSTGDYGARDYQGGDYRGDRWVDSPARGFGAGERADQAYGNEHADLDYHGRDHADRDYAPAGYGRGDPVQAGYPGPEHKTDDYERSAYERPSYEAADYGSRGYGRGEPDYVTGDYSTGGFGTRQGSDPGHDYRSGEVGYRDDRVVPPYVQGQEDSYLNDYRAPGTGYQGDIRDPAYPADRRPVSPSYGYPEPPDQQDSYSYGSDDRYRLAADADSDEGNSVGRSSGRRAG